MQTRSKTVCTRKGTYWLTYSNSTRGATKHDWNELCKRLVCSQWCERRLSQNKNEKNCPKKQVRISHRQRLNWKQIWRFCSNRSIFWRQRFFEQTFISTCLDTVRFTLNWHSRPDRVTANVNPDSDPSPHTTSQNMWLRKDSRIAERPFNGTVDIFCETEQKNQTLRPGVKLLPTSKHPS